MGTQRLPASPPPPHAFRSSLIRRNRSFEIEICSESWRTVDSSRTCEAEESIIVDDPHLQKASPRSSPSGNDGIVFSGHGDGKGFHAEKLQFCTSLRLKSNTDEDDDDGMRWANAMGPLQAALGSFGYGESKVSCAAQMAPGIENKVRFPCKFASFPCAIAWQQHAGPIKPNSGPFAGPLRVTTKPNSAVKALMAPPAKLFCRNKLAFHACEPMSPEITCLGRVKIKDCIHKEDVGTTTDDKPGSLEQKVGKGRCFYTKNQLCGKKAKGRKKKKSAEKSRCLSRRRRVVSKDGADTKSSLYSKPGSEFGETRREKAASLAKSLTGLLHEMREHQTVSAQYVPCVPPANSLILMRGHRMREEICSLTRRNVEEATIDDCHDHDSLRVESLDQTGNTQYVPCVPPANSLILMRGHRMREEICSLTRRNVEEATIDDCHDHDSFRVESLDEGGPGDTNVKNSRKSVSLHLSLHELIDMEDEVPFTSDVKGTMMTQRTRAIGQGTSLHERENSRAGENDDKKNEFIDRGSSLMPPPRASLWQRRAISELTAIEVKQQTKHDLIMR